MDKVSNIKIKMECLLTEMYELGKEDGYSEAMSDYRIPDF